jgi:inorganic pyrophosphatase
MVLWDVPSFPGVLLRCRAIGVIYVEQNRVNFDATDRVRNDRLLVVPVAARREADLTDVASLPARVRAELEHFAGAATALEGKEISVTGWGGPADALALVRSAAQRAPT